MHKDKVILSAMLYSLLSGRLASLVLSLPMSASKKWSGEFLGLIMVRTNEIARSINIT